MKIKTKSHFTVLFTFCITSMQSITELDVWLLNSTEWHPISLVQTEPPSYKNQIELFSRSEHTISECCRWKKTRWLLFIMLIGCMSKAKHCSQRTENDFFKFKKINSIMK